MKKSHRDMIAALTDALDYHPNTPLGKLISNAVNISRGQLQSNPAFATDAEILNGLKALKPDDWEIEKDKERGKK